MNQLPLAASSEFLDPLLAKQQLAQERACALLQAKQDTIFAHAPFPLGKCPPSLASRAVSMSQHIPVLCYHFLILLGLELLGLLLVVSVPTEATGFAFVLVHSLMLPGIFFYDFPKLILRRSCALVSLPLSCRHIASKVDQTYWSTLKEELRELHYEIRLIPFLKKREIGHTRLSLRWKATARPKRWRKRSST